MADESFAPPKAGSYDRIVSIEMFEHMKARVCIERGARVASY
jgi:cyclopropane fatty-acyl-phospholipid synthase-like methyltransferase